jgi:hypothetical protein
MQYPRIDLPALDILPRAGMAAVDANVEMYEAGVTFI